MESFVETEEYMKYLKAVWQFCELCFCAAEETGV